MKIKEEIFLKYYKEEDLPLMKYYNDNINFEKVNEEEDFEVPEIFQKWFDLNYSHLI